MSPGPRRTVRAAAVAVAGALLLTACSGVESGGTSGYISGDGTVTTLTPNERQPAPVLAGEDLDGNPISTEDFAGQTLVINSWGSWCPPCRAEAPALRAVSEEYADQNVQFIGVLIKDKPAAAKAFNEAQGITYPSIQDFSGETLLGFADSMPSQAIPTTWIIDEEGRVAVRITDPELGATTLGDLIDFTKKSSA